MPSVAWDIPEDILEDDSSIGAVSALSDFLCNLNIRPGVINDLSNEDYHAHPSISKSGLDAINKSPAHYIKSEHKETPAFKKGTLIHCAILEPDYLDSRYCALTEKLDLRTKKGKEKYAEQEVIANGRIIVTAEEWVMAIRVREEVSNHKIAKHLFDGGVSETSIFSSLDDTAVRCRPDYWNGSIVIDLKSTDDAAHGFINSAKKYRYYVQHPYYCDVMESEGIEISNFLFVAIEKTEPFGINVYELDDDAIEYGRSQYLLNLDTYKRCLDTGKWPCYEQSIKTLSLPRYVTNNRG